MNAKLQLQTWAAAGILFASLAASLAQPAAPQPAPNPIPAPVLDPNTGLPLPTSEPQWVDPNWKDPDLVLTNVEYNDLPLNEVARQLRDQFKNYFDILSMPTTFDRDWGSDTIQLQLKNVRASEIFNAMNLVFENDRTPVRWELKAPAGGRPLVLLRVLPQAEPPSARQTGPPPTQRMVYYVGDLVGDEKTGGMSMEEIVKAITDLWPAEFGKSDGVIQFHKEAQLLVVNGTHEQLDFVHQTLAALEQKAAAARPKDDASKHIEELGNLIKTLKDVDNNTK